MWDLATIIAMNNNPELAPKAASAQLRPVPTEEEDVPIPEFILDEVEAHQQEPLAVVMPREDWDRVAALLRRVRAEVLHKSDPAVSKLSEILYSIEVNL